MASPAPKAMASGTPAEPVLLRPNNVEGLIGAPFNTMPLKFAVQVTSPAGLTVMMGVTGDVLTSMLKR
jgi:hypothetical protein